MSAKKDLLLRFWEKVDRRAPDDCWLWLACVNKDGYGKILCGRAAVLAHRVSLEIKLGRKIKEGVQACHSCDNPACVNPKHLFEGTQRDNVYDCIKKGRRALGERNGGGGKLKELDVVNIRGLLRSGVKARVIAAAYNIHFNTVYDIKKRKIWKRLVCL